MSLRIVRGGICLSSDAGVFVPVGGSMIIPFFTMRMASEADEFLTRLAGRANPEENERSVEETVASILADVKERGLAALVDYTRRFDAPDFSESRFVIPEAELAWAA
jgi:histidinol dehydrogenase